MSASGDAEKSIARTHLAFFGSRSLLARELRALVECRAFPVADVSLYDSVAEGTVTGFGGEATVLTRPDEDLAPGIDVAFMCGTVSDTLDYIEWPARHGYVAIDLSGAAAGPADIPIVHAGVNPEAIVVEGKPAPVIVAPHPVSHNVATLVAALGACARVEAVEIVALLPAAERGEPGVDELYQQTVALLNFASVPAEVFGRQLAFSVLPSVPRAKGAIDGRIREETSRILKMESCRIGVASALVPLFHGHVTLVTVVFGGTPPTVTNAGAIRDALGRDRGIRLLEDPGAFSPVDLAGEEAVAVAGPAIDSLRPDRATFWCFCDNLKGGAALNAVRIAERVVDMLRESER